MRLPARFGLLADYGVERGAARKEPGETASSFDVQKEADRLLLARFAPAGIIVNSEQEIVHFRGRTGAFLAPTPGQASFSLPKMAREGLLVDLLSALQKAKKDDLPVRKQRVEIRSNGTRMEVDLEVIPIRGPSALERYFLILFEEAANVPAELRKSGAKGAKSRAMDLKGAGKMWFGCSPKAKPTRKWRLRLASASKRQKRIERRSCARWDSAPSANSSVSRSPSI